MRRQRRKMGKKLLSLLLTVAILLTMQGIPAKVADAAVENKVVSVFEGAAGAPAVITVNGDLYCWGPLNWYGQVGNGSTESQTTPVKVLENVATFSEGNYNSAAITTNGDLYCWGCNESGQVGNGSTENQTTPVKVLEDVATVSIGVHSSAAITTNGDLYCWGSNEYGAVGIGYGNTGNQTTPVKVLENVDSIFLEYSSCAAIMKNGDLYRWGRNNIGQIGNSSRQTQYTPIKVLENVNIFLEEDGDCAAIMKNGDLYCWGSNYYGEVGSNSLYDFESTPVKVLENVVSVSPGNTHAAITTNGDLYCWGCNESGEVGNGSTKNQTTPVKVLEDVVSVLPADTCTAVTTNGDLYRWGFNFFGCLGNGTNTNQLVPIKINLPPDNQNILGTGEVVNQNIIDRVSEYTSDELYAQYDKITNSDYSHDTKNKMYQSLFQSYGITDVREGIRYLSNTTNKRYAYLTMTTDDLYCASNFKYWLKNTTKGKAAQAALLADGLIFNGEINDWLDFTTYLETDYPGVAKYKAMLYDFMDASSDSIEIVSNIKLVSDMASKTTGAAKLKADNLIEQLNHCSTAAEAERLMNSSAAMEVWTELAKAKDETGNFVRDNNGSIELTYKLDESSGFGQFSKAMGQAAKGISIADMALSDVKDLLTLDSKLAVYAQYRRFLQDIVSDTDGLPFQMRWAAALILTELEENYYAKIKDIVWEIINQTSINSAVLKQIIGETAAGSLSSWLNVIGIETFFINKIADIGEMVKKESAVEGYASLSSAFTKKLERSKQAFLANKTESNAWDFYYNYNILYRLRYKGEEAYLSMTKIKGFLSCFSDFGYAEKEAVVNDTLQMLESRCQFTLDEAQPIPESCQFASKSVINCPVNVSIYAEDGRLIAELLDGVESDVTNEYGRFAVVYDAYSGDYEKVICLNSEENVSFKITGTDDGLVTMDFAQAKDEESNIYTFDSVPIDKDAVINTTVQEITEQNAYGVDTDADGEIDEQGTITVKPETYVSVESVVLSETALELNTGESSVLRVAVTPTNATNQKVLWMSADPTIAAVTDGKVTAIADGNTTIYCMILDNMDKMISCEVNVSSNIECTHQSTEVRSQLEETCDTEGYTGDTYCKDCNAKLETGQVIAATGEHTWNDGEEIRSSTCMEKGETKYTCTVCGKIKTEETEKKGHQNTEMRNQLTATCGIEGYTGDIYCKDCHTKIETGQVIAATGEHIWNDGEEIKSPTCTEKGEKEFFCIVCGEKKKEKIKELVHTYKTTVTKATTAKNGSVIEKCTACGDIKSNRVIPSVTTVVLKSSSQIYNGKAKKPSVIVKNSSGKVVDNHNYTVVYKNNKKIGKATATIELKGNYAGTIIKTFSILPQGTSISGKVTATSKGFQVKWKKQKKNITGYQIQYSTSRKFKKKATVIQTIKKKSVTQLTVKKLKSKKKYYVRIRTYKTVKGKKYYSGWSKSKKVITKK